MKPKRARSSYVLLVGLMGLLVVGALIAYQVYAALTGTQITERQREAINPLDGVIDESVLDNLAGRRKFSETDFSSLVLNIVETPATPAGSVATAAGQPQP